MYALEGFATKVSKYPVGGWEVVYWQDHIPHRKSFETVEEAWSYLHQGLESGQLMPEGVSHLDKTVVCFAEFCNEPGIRPDSVRLWYEWEVFENRLSGVFAT